MTAPLRELSDEEVAREARVRPREAFEVLFERYQRPVYAHLIRAGAPQGRVDDLFQTAFLKAYRAIRSFREESKFKTWLFTIATHVLMDEWRRAGRQGRTASLEGVVVSDEDTSGREAERKEETALVRRAVQTLPEPSRTLFLLVRFQGMKVADAAVAAGIKPSSAKVTLFRAQQKVGAALMRVMKPREGKHVS